MDIFSLSGKNALIIGGAGGIGSVIARAYRDGGARVVVAGRSQAKMASIADELSPRDPSKAAYVVDACYPAALSELAATLSLELGTVDVLVNCQGTTTIKPALEVTEEEYDSVADTNLKSVFFACTAFAPHMIAQRSGAIINIASLAAHSGWAQAASYSASKSGVVSLTRSFAAEWGQDGVRVNAITPGFFMTDLNRSRMSDSRKQRATDRCAMKRMGELPELAGAAVYLASDAAGFVNGSTLRVDGGYLSSGI